MFYAISLLIASGPSSEIVVELGALCSLLGIIAGAIAWIGGLVKQAKQRQWGWFIGTIFFGIVCLAIYLLVVPEAPAYQVYQPKQDYQPGLQHESVYYYQPQPYQEPVHSNSPQQTYGASSQQTYQEMEQPESYQEAMKPEFYQEQRPPDA